MGRALAVSFLLVVLLCWRHYKMTLPVVSWFLLFALCCCSTHSDFFAVGGISKSSNVMGN